MLPPMDNVRAHAQRVADALVDVVDSARWEARISSIRDLAARAEMTHTALNKRMRRETPFNVRDLAAIGRALEIEPNELLRRAVAKVAAENGVTAELGSASERPSVVQLSAVIDLDEPASQAKPTSSDEEGEAARAVSRLDRHVRDTRPTRKRAMQQLEDQAARDEKSDRKDDRA